MQDLGKGLHVILSCKWGAFHPFPRSKDSVSRSIKFGSSQSGHIAGARATWSKEYWLNRRVVWLVFLAWRCFSLCRRDCYFWGSEDDKISMSTVAHSDFP